MNRLTAPTALAAMLLALLLLGCPDEEQVDARQAQINLAMEARGEALQLLAAGNSQAAQETLYRAYRHALDAVEVEGAMSTPDLLNILAELSFQLGQWAPDYLGRAVRYSHMAIESGPGWGVPYLTLGLAYERAGLFRDSVRAYERFFELVPSEHVPKGTDANLVRALFMLAAEILREDRIGAEGQARVVLEQAFALRPNPKRAPQVHQLLTKINKLHAAEIRVAVEAGDGLEIVRIHARYGYPIPAETALQMYKDASGSNRDVRFVEARFVRELAGTPESLEQAAEIYLDLISRGEMVVHAAAGYGRVMLASGEGEKALARLGDFPNPTAELRRALVLLRVNRISRIPAEDSQAAAEEFATIEELMTGGLQVQERARLYFAVAVAALQRDDPEQLEKIIRTYQTRFPQDTRVAILDAELKMLRRIPVEEVFAEGVDD